VNTSEEKSKKSAAAAGATAADVRLHTQKKGMKMKVGK